MGKRRERPHSANWDPKGESFLALDSWPFSISFPVSAETEGRLVSSSQGLGNYLGT